MKKIFLGLFVLIAVLSLTVVLVKAENETSVALTDGVQIRTDGNNGLRWEATVTNPKEGQVYGFLFAQGELTKEQLNKDINNSFSLINVDIFTINLSVAISVKLQEIELNNLLSVYRFNLSVCQFIMKTKRDCFGFVFVLL